MKIYTFNVSVDNSATIEVQADNYNSAEESALKEIYRGGYLNESYELKDMEINIELKNVDELKTAHTYMIGDREDAEQRCRELNDMLGMWRRSDFHISSDEHNTQNPEDGARVLGIYIEEITGTEISEFELDKDFIIN